MKKTTFTPRLKPLLLYLVLMFPVVAFTGCDTDTAPVPVASALSTDVTSGAKPAYPGAFVAPMDGRQEATPNNSKATGNAVFKVSKDGTEIHYKLIVANIENITMAHIHLAPVGVNGGVVVWLYPAAPPMQLIPGRSNGILAEGVITQASLVNALAGRPLSELLDAIMAGNAYVNVHTLQYPGGEIRGQIK